MPVHTFNEIGLSYANGKVSVTYPNPAWGYYKGGEIPTAQIEAQIAEAMKHTETAYINYPNKSIDLTATHKVRYVNAEDACNKYYEQGKRDGEVIMANSLFAKIGKINVWDGIASRNVDPQET